MSSISESYSSLLASALSTSTTKAVLVASTLAYIAYTIRAISPTRLTQVLVSALASAENAYIQAIESTSFRCELSAAAERLVSLQLDVSILREAALRDSRSLWVPMSQYLHFRRARALLLCIWEVRALENDIEIIKEGLLRDIPLEAGVSVRTISMRRRLVV
ncbi:hypothetical protein B0H11DRAFT_2214962 [Mycena galericulata]|nr:hypothetical protein B0H11DRAFT_2214962 [Mycena galericulata]